jgi:hypothetical protein
MVANLVARNPRVYLGADQQDWSAAVGDIAVQQDSIGQGGLVTATATIDFFDVGPESISPIANPARWREGAAVQIAMADDDGNFVVVANLFILTIPASPVDGLLSVEAGCWLAWAAKVAKEGDRSGITLGDETNAAGVAQRLLVAAGIPLASINLGTWDYVQRWPLQKEGNGSYVDQAARLAYACNHRHLYQDPSGVIRAAQWSTTPGTVVAAITAGLDEALFEEAPDAIQPTEIVEVVGQGFEVLTQPQVISESSTVTELASNFGDQYEGRATTSSTTTWIFERWGDTETTWWEENETLVSQPSLAVFVTGGGLGGTVTSNRSRRSYLKSTGRLSQEVATERVDWRQILPGGQFGNSTISGTAARKEVTADYSYNAQEVLTAIVTTTRVPRFFLDPETSFASNTGIEREQVVRWREVQPDQWTQTSTEVVAAAIAGGRIDNVKGTALVAQTPQVQLNSRPPATQRWENKVSSKEQHFEARALWVHPGGATGLERITQITVEPGFSNAQCFEIATKEAQLLEGRRLAYVVEVPLSTALLWVPPLSTFTVDDGANLWTFRADGLVWTYYTDEARLAFTGICIARVPVAVPVGVALPTFATGLEAGQSAPAEPAAFVQPGDDAEPVPVDAEVALSVPAPGLAAETVLLSTTAVALPVPAPAIAAALLLTGYAEVALSVPAPGVVAVVDVAGSAEVALTVPAPAMSAAVDVPIVATVALLVPKPGLSAATQTPLVTDYDGNPLTDYDGETITVYGV